MFQIWIPLLSLAVGAGLGSLLSFSIPLIYAKYLSIAILAALDSILGGTRAIINHTFDSVIMLSGFFMNAILAAVLAFLGDKIGIDMFLATTVCFSLRIFSNLAFIRRDLITAFREKREDNVDVKKAKISKMPTALPVAKNENNNENVDTDDNMKIVDTKNTDNTKIVEEENVPLKVKAVHSSELGPDANISTTIQIIDIEDIDEIKKEIAVKQELDANKDAQIAEQSEIEPKQEENLLKQYTEDELARK